MDIMTDEEKKAETALLKRLYNAADLAAGLRLWETFCEVDICEIYLKDGREPYYCSIQGMFEDEHSISVYAGHDGLVSLSNYINGAELPDYVETSRKNCLECSWVSRGGLRRRDLAQIKAAGRKYRGAGAWPLFRHFETGCEPYYLDDDQMEILTLVLEELCRGFQEMKQEGQLEKTEEGARLRRMYDREKDCWVNDLLAPIEKIEAVSDGCLITDELLIRRLRKKPVNGCSLEFDMPYLPVRNGLTDDRGRSRLQRLCILCDSDKGSVEQQYFLTPVDDPRDVALGMLVNYIEEKGRPVTVYIRNTELYGIAGHLCSETGVELCLSNMLNMLDFFVEDIIEQFEQK